MALSIGVEARSDHWKTCLLENGRIVELLTFTDDRSGLHYLETICAHYPEPSLALAAQTDFPIALKYKNLLSYAIPMVEHLTSVPLHRKMQHVYMGTADKLCIVAALLFYMRQREAAWSEMRFLHLHVDHCSRNIIAVEDGQIVNGIGEKHGMLSLESDIADEIVIEEAFWEKLTQELAGFMAIHHFEDIVITGQQKEYAITRLGDNYQFYHFPDDDPLHQGFEAAIGAAIIAEGLSSSGLASEIVNRLQIGLAPAYQLAGR